jgi:hypothetical protein
LRRRSIGSSRRLAVDANGWHGLPTTYLWWVS